MKRQPTITLYCDADAQWRWRYVAGNGRILADSGQGYADGDWVSLDSTRRTSGDIHILPPERTDS